MHMRRLSRLPHQLTTNSIYIMTNDSPSLGTHRYDALIVDHIPFDNLKTKVTQILNDLNKGESVKTNDSVNPISQQNYIGKVMYVIQGLGRSCWSHYLSGPNKDI
jgi:hypothetical protein